jgi:hypothetical protein
MDGSGQTTSRRRTKLAVLCAVVALLIVAGFITSRMSRAASAPLIPAATAEQVLHPIYVPDTLPEGYSLDESSLQTDEGVLMFYLVNQAGQRIVFSQQAEPKEFDFNTFHKKSLKHPRSLTGMPYPTVIGTSEGDTALMSIRADKTWVIVTAKPNQPAALEQIARSLKRQ